MLVHNNEDLLQRNGVNFNNISTGHQHELRRGRFFHLKDSNKMADKEIYGYKKSESINFMLSDEGDNASAMVGCKPSPRNRVFNCQYRGLRQEKPHWQIHWHCHWQIRWHWHGL